MLEPLVMLFRVVLIVLFISSIVFFILMAKVKIEMERKDKQNQRMGVEPSGSAITHGMIRRGEGGRGVISDSKPSLAWYLRLLN